MGQVLELQQPINIVSQFLESVGSENTVRSYTKTIKDFFGVKDINIITNKMIQNVTFQDAQKFINSLIDKELKSATIKQKKACLQGLFREAIDEEIIEDNIFNSDRIKRIIKNKTIKNEEYNGRPLNENEIEELLNIILIKNDGYEIRDHLMVSLMFRTGVRCCEMVELRWDHILYNSIADKWYIQVIGKGKKEREIPLSNKAVEEIKEYGKDSFGELGNGCSKRLFNMTTGNVNRILHKYCSYLDFDISAHDCRRSFSTLTTENNMPVATLQQLLGHENITTTQRYIKKHNMFKNDINNYVTW